MPAWEAITPQLPTFRNLTVFPEMLQLPFWTTVKVTGRPEVAPALTVREDPRVCAGIALNVMVCAAGAEDVTTSVSLVVSTVDPEVPVIVSG